GEPPEEFEAGFAPEGRYADFWGFFQSMALQGLDDLAAAAAATERYSMQACAGGARGLDALWWRPLLAGYRARLGDVQAALSNLAVAEELLGTDGYRGSSTPMHRARAEIAAASGDLATAETHMGLTVDSTQRWRQGFFEPLVLRDWGRILITHGDTVRGVEKLDAAAELYRSLGAGQRWIDSVLALRPV
ncbi:MAG: hypothetical protein KY395_04180, partial [Actinobacteria bacterium]|nr:hypothetical protein [Actinomycetota bacterium]